MNTASGLTNDMIRNNSIYASIDMYLKEGETKEAMVKKFGGNLDKTIQFLRDRSYESLEIVERKPKPADKPKPVKEKVAEKKKAKGTKKSSSQEKLF